MNKARRKQLSEIAEEQAAEQMGTALDSLDEAVQALEEAQA